MNEHSVGEVSAAPYLEEIHNSFLERVFAEFFQVLLEFTYVKKKKQINRLKNCFQRWIRIGDRFFFFIFFSEEKKLFGFKFQSDEVQLPLYPTGHRV